MPRVHDALATTRLRAKKIPGHFLPRRFRLYGVGDGKTGTTTLAQKFGRYRSAHEWDRKRFVPVSIGVLNGTLSRDDARAALRRRNWRFNLEVDSAHFLAPVAGVIADLYPDAHFVLLIRDCFSWLDARVEWSTRGALTPLNVEALAARYARYGERPAPEEAVLTRAGLDPIAGYLRYWSELPERVQGAVPRERLLVVRTEDLDSSNERLAELVGVDPATILTAHANHNENRSGLLGQVPREFVLDRIEEHCTPLMQRYWGDDWRSLVSRLPA